MDFPGPFYISYSINIAYIPSKESLTFHHNGFPEPGESVACFSSASILFTCVCICIIRVRYPSSSALLFVVISIRINHPKYQNSISTLPNTKVWILIQAHPDQKKFAADFASADPAGKHKQTFRSRLRIRSVRQINSEQRPCSHNWGL